MLDTLYTLWFWLFGLKAMSKDQNYLPKITQRALSLLDSPHQQGTYVIKYLKTGGLGLRAEWDHPSSNY